MSTFPSPRLSSLKDKHEAQKAAAVAVSEITVKAELVAEELVKVETEEKVKKLKGKK